MNNVATVVPDDIDAADYDPMLGVIRALGVIAIVIATAGLAVVPLGAERFHEGSILGAPNVDLYYPIARPTIDALWLLFGTMFWLGLSTGLFLAGVGCVRLRWWARRALLLWATAAVIVAAGGGVFYLRWLLPAWRDGLAQVRGDVDALVTFYIWALSGVLAVALLICLNRRDVRRKFRDLRLKAE